MNGYVIASVTAAVTAGVTAVVSQVNTGQIPAWVSLSLIGTVFLAGGSFFVTKHETKTAHARITKLQEEQERKEEKLDDRLRERDEKLDERLDTLAKTCTQTSIDVATLLTAQRLREHGQHRTRATDDMPRSA